MYQYIDQVDNIRISYSDKDKDGKIDIERGDLDIDGDGDLAMEIRQEKNYYPFGLQIKGYNDDIIGTPHNYGFGGKEEQDELGLGWVDITARNYNPELGRWMNLDPLAEAMRKHSPYNYAFDNPVYFIDPDGNMPCPNGDCDTQGPLTEEESKKRFEGSAKPIVITDTDTKQGFEGFRAEGRINGELGSFTQGSPLVTHIEKEKKTMPHQCGKG